MLVSTKDMLLKAQKEHYAVGNFCIWNVEMLSGVMEACEALKSPLILSFGSGFLANTNIDHFIKMMRSYAESTSLPCSIHWDHGRNIDIVSHAIDIGYNSLMIDGSSKPFEENVRMTKEVVDKFHPMGIPIEGELGHIANMGMTYEEALKGYNYTDPDEAKEFVERTNVDLLAIGVGNQHGAYTAPPKIRFDIIEAVRSKVDIPLVLHGASGIPNNDVSRAIDLGITKINIHTEFCEAAMSAIDAKKPDESYLTLNQEVREAVRKRCEEKIMLFRSNGKAEGWFEK